MKKDGRGEPPSILSSFEAWGYGKDGFVNRSDLKVYLRQKCEVSTNVISNHELIHMLRCFQGGEAYYNARQVWEFINFPLVMMKQAQARIRSAANTTIGQTWWKLVAKSHPNGAISQPELFTLCRKKFRITHTVLPDPNIHAVFMVLDVNRAGSIPLDGLISFVMEGYTHQNDTLSHASVSPPSSPANQPPSSPAIPGKRSSSRASVQSQRSVHALKSADVDSPVRRQARPLPGTHEWSTSSGKLLTA